MQPLRTSIWLHDSNETASGKPGTLQSDPASWWGNHRPLMIQTGALGPIEDSHVNFAGFRVITVTNNVITAINFISADRLAQNNYELSWEDAIRIDPPRHLPFVGRSEQYGAPTAAEPPHVCSLGGNVYDIVYRNGAGQVLELWRDADNGQSGTGNLTAVAQAPLATGSPRPYVNTNIDQMIVPYRAADGVVHSVYSLPGGTGHDNLSGTANGPKAEGNPSGFYNPGSDLHHVIYRSSDGHLHAIYWHANEVAAQEDLFWTPFPAAAGDPSAYFGGGSNVIAYRGKDGEIHTIYWSGADAAGHDSLSAVAGMPHAAGDPIAYHFLREGQDTHQVTYRATDGQIIELWWVGAAPVQGFSPSAAAGAPPAASDPAAYYNPEADAKYVTYISADGHIHECRWKPGGPVAHSDLTIDTGAPLGQGQPSAFYVSGPRTRHVVYKGQDGHVYEIVLKYGRALPGELPTPMNPGGGGVLNG